MRGVLELEGRSFVSEGVVPYDIRLKREITHRHLFLARVRRVIRICGLHVLDGFLIGALAFALTHLLPSLEPFQRFVPAVVAIHLLSLNAAGAYLTDTNQRHYRQLALAVALGTLTLAALALFPPGLPIAPLYLALFAGLGWALLGAGRALADRFAQRAGGRSIGLRRVLLVGNADDVSRAIEELRDGRNKPDIVGHVTPAAGPDARALSAVDEIGRVIEEQNVQEVIVTSVLPPPALRHVASCCFQSGAALLMIPPVPAAGEYRAESLRVGRSALLRLHPARLEFPALLAKRAFDLVIAGVALILFAPLMAVIALAIKLDSPGPVFFRATRVGLGGQLFHMWKFRSMYADAEAREQELAHLNIYPNGTFKIANDPRVTRVGRLLRRTSLDELPQLFNVLIGNMSLVGPRPALPSDLDRYQPHHFQRLTVIPGITGPWQVAGRNLITDFETIIGMERQYIQSWSLLLDVKILLRTPRVVWRGEGAY